MRDGEEGVQDLLHKRRGADCSSLPMEVARAGKRDTDGEIMPVGPGNWQTSWVGKIRHWRALLVNNKACELKQ